MRVFPVVFLFSLTKSKSQVVQMYRDIKLLTRNFCLLTRRWVTVPELSWPQIFGRPGCDGKGLRVRSEVENKRRCPYRTFCFECNSSSHSFPCVLMCTRRYIWQGVENIIIHILTGHFVLVPELGLYIHTLVNAML